MITMTPLPEPRLVIKKGTLIEGGKEEDIIQMQVGDEVIWTDSLDTMIWTAMGILFFSLMSFVNLTQMHYPFQHSHQDVWFCSVPLIAIPSPAYEDTVLMIPLRWSLTPEALPEDLPEVGMGFGDLRQKFHIGHSVENISVIFPTDNARLVSFIHDFDANLTGIVDNERCFTTALDRDVVMEPAQMLQAIQRTSEWDVSPVRTTLRARRLLPAHERALSRDVRAACCHKPHYSLVSDDAVAHKRSLFKAPSCNYMSFSGKHVQRLEITNMANVLQHEHGMKQL